VADEYFTTITRSMLGYVREVGAMPFMLYEYFMTYQTAPDGIRPSLETIARDLGILDKKGKPSKSAVCNLKKILIEKEWIREENGRIVLLKSFRNSERRSEIMKGHSEKMNESFRNSERPLKEEDLKQERKIEKDISSAHEKFSSDSSNWTNEEQAAQIEAAFLWLRQKKNLNRLPQSEWISLFAELEAEGIMLADGFKEYYLWVENLDWVTGVVSVKLLRGQIEAYKNRDHLESKRKIKHGSNYDKDSKPKFGTVKSGKDGDLSDDEWRAKNAHLLPAED
jgi:hypothetical protein